MPDDFWNGLLNMKPLLPCALLPSALSLRALSLRMCLPCALLCLVACSPQPDPADAAPSVNHAQTAPTLSTAQVQAERIQAAQAEQVEIEQAQARMTGQSQFFQCDQNFSLSVRYRYSSPQQPSATLQTSEQQQYILSQHRLTAQGEQFSALQAAVQWHIDQQSAVLHLADGRVYRCQRDASQEAND